MVPDFTIMRHFKNFSLIEENGVTALYLVTSQRLMPPLTVYLPSGKDKVIIQTLSRVILLMFRVACSGRIV